MKNRISMVLDEDEFMTLWKYCLEDLRLPNNEELCHVLMLKSRRLLRKKSREFTKMMIPNDGNKFGYSKKESTSRLFAELTPEKLSRLGRLIVQRSLTPRKVIE